MLSIKCRKDIRMGGKTTGKITYEVKIKKANWLWIAGAWKCHGPLHVSVTEEKIPGVCVVVFFLTLTAQGLETGFLEL